MAMTGYILAGSHLEEHDLLAYYGETYGRYRRRVRCSYHSLSMVVSILDTGNLSRKPFDADTR